MTNPPCILVLLRQHIGVGNIKQSRTRYEWDNLDRLKRVENEITGTHTLYNYDKFDSLISATYKSSGQRIEETIYRIPDKIGNLYKTPECADRVYDKGGQLIEDDKYHFHCDAEGNLIFKEFKKNGNSNALSRIEQAIAFGLSLKGSRTGWMYFWGDNGMLKEISSQAGNRVSFTYDPLGRRMAKSCKGRTTR